MDIVERFKSPVVLVQLLTILGTLFVLFNPGYDQAVKEVVASLGAIINVIAGLNNPTDKEQF